MGVGPCFAVLLSLVALVVVLFSFIGVDTTVPKQVPYRFTGYLTWLPELKGFDANTLDATLFFNNLIVALSSYYAIKWAYNPPKNNKFITYFISGDARPISTVDLDRVIANYIIITFICGIAIFIVGVGKIWVGVGVLHNAAEFVILVILGSGGKIKAPAFWPILGFYIALVALCSILFKFPYDALWFKGQGLVFDWALIIEFVRVYLHTRHELKHGNVDLLTNLNNTEENQDDADNDHDHAYHAIVHHPHQLLLLITGSIFHVLGNVVFTVYRFSFWALLAFFYSYVITFPAYAYYIYLDTHVTSIYPQKRIYLPETPYWKAAVIAITSITLAFLTIRFGV